MNNPLVKLKLLLEDKLKGGMDRAKKFVSENVKDMQDKLNGLKVSHVKAFKSMKDEIPGFGRAMELLGNPYLLLTAGLIAITGALSHARAEAALWDKSMAKVNVTAQLTKPELKKLSDTILDIGARNTTPLQEVPEAFNRIISAGLDTNTALEALEPTLKAAKAGFTDVETTAKAAVSVMNSSGVMDANRVYDILFATLNRGNAEFADIAQYLPKIIPGAKQAGFSLEQVAGSFAFLTAQGLSAEQSTTGLMNAFKALSDKDIVFGSKSRKGLLALGINVFDAKNEMRPLVEIVDQLKGKLEGLNSSDKIKFLDQIGFDMEASTALAVMTQNIDKLKENIDFTTNSQGQLQKAVENSATATESWDIIGNKVKKTFIEIGQPINDSFGKLGEEILPYIESGLETMKDILPGIMDFLGDIGGIVWTVWKTSMSLVGTVLDWIMHSRILKDLFTAIGWAVSTLADGIGWVADKLSWLMDHTVKPLLDALEWVYEKMQSLFGDPLEAAREKLRNEIEQKIADGVIKIENLTPDELKQLEDLGISTGGTNELADIAAQTALGVSGLSKENMYKQAGGNKTRNSFSGGKDKKESSMAISGKAEQVRNITVHAQTIGISGDISTNSKDMPRFDEKGCG